MNFWHLPSESVKKFVWVPIIGNLSGCIGKNISGEKDRILTSVSSRGSKVMLAVNLETVEAGWWQFTVAEVFSPVNFYKP